MKLNCAAKVQNSSKWNYGVLFFLLPSQLCKSMCVYAPQSMQQFVQQQNFPTDSFSRQLLLLLAKLIRLANNQAERFRQTFVQRLIGGSCNSENNNNNNNDTMNMHSKCITKRNCNIINAIFSCICAHWDSALGVCVI